MEKLTGNELIEYGFKRVIEELQKNRAEIINLQNDLLRIREEVGKIKCYEKLNASQLERIEKALTGERNA